MSPSTPPRSAPLDTGTLRSGVDAPGRARTPLTVPDRRPAPGTPDRTDARATTAAGVTSPDDPQAPSLRGAAFWIATVAAVLFVSLLRFVYLWVGDVADGDAGSLPRRVFDELTGLAAGLPLVLVMVALARRETPERVGWRRALLAVAASFVVFTLCHTTLMVWLRATFGDAVGYRGPDYAAARYAFEAANDLIVVTGFVSTLWLLDAWLARSARERREAALARALDVAHLQNLRLQLQPHFLFNALNTISAAMYEDPAAADAMLQHLAELLRVSLRTESAQQVTLREELELLAHYESLMRARLGDRLSLVVDVAPAALDVAVPSLLLQPLVENAVRHGRIATEGAGRIVVRVTLEVETLLLDVHDDGPGIAPGCDALATAGTGLAATARRLHLLHGDAASLGAGNVDGGFAVRVRIPALVRA